MELDRVLAVLQAMHDLDVDYVLVGGVAINFHGIARATEDVDVFIRAEAENIERVKGALRQVWDDPAIEHISAEDLTGDYPVVRYGPPDVKFVIDIMSRLGQAFTFEDLEVVDLVIDGVPVRAATPRTLYEMKRETVRPIDRWDAAELRDRFGFEDD